MNRIVNPWMRFLLRSPLHRLAGKATVLVSYTGRRSGRSFSLPVQHARDGSTVWVLVGWPDRKAWWRNFDGGGAARLRLRGRWVEANGSVVRGTEDLEAVRAAASVYGEQLPKARRSLGLPAEGEPAEQQVDDALGKAVFVRFDPAA